MSANTYGQPACSPALRATPLHLRVRPAFPRSPQTQAAHQATKPPRTPYNPLRPCVTPPPLARTRPARHAHAPPRAPPPPRSVTPPARRVPPAASVPDPPSASTPCAVCPATRNSWQCAPWARSAHEPASPVAHFPSSPHSLIMPSAQPRTSGGKSHPVPIVLRRVRFWISKVRRRPAPTVRVQRHPDPENR